MDEYKCGKCFTIFSNIQLFLSHKIKECDSLIGCLLCSTEKQFPSKNHLVLHLLQEHTVHLEIGDTETKQMTNLASEKSSLNGDPGNEIFLTSPNDNPLVENDGLAKLDESSANQLCPDDYKPMMDKVLAMPYTIISNQKENDPKRAENIVFSSFGNTCTYTTASVINPRTDTVYSALNGKPLLSPLSIGDMAPGYNTEHLKSIRPNPLSGGSVGLLQSAGSTTTILLPLPLDLNATRSFCEALNLNLGVTQPNHFSPQHNSADLTKQEIHAQKALDSSVMLKREDIHSESQEDATKLSPSFIIVGPKPNSVVPILSNTKISPHPKPTHTPLSPSITAEEELDIGALDFYFLLGNISIKGNSLTYERTEFRCLHCSFSTAWHPSLVKHMKTTHKDILEIHAMLEIRNKDSFSGIRQDNGDCKWKDFQVIKMSQYVVGNQKLKLPRKRIRKPERQDAPGKYHCPTCHKVFSRLRYMRRHLATHRTERTHLCDNCGKSFKTKAILVSHRRSHKSKNYHCPQCSFVSNSSAAIHLHRQLHPNGSVICEICGNAYIDRSTLNKHMKVHDYNRPFPCTHPGCTWRFKTDVMRKAHVRSHTTVGKFSCPQCGYNFRQKHHLQRHVARIHNGQPVKQTLPLLSPALNLNLPSTQTASAFTSQAITIGHEILLTSTTDHDLLKSTPNTQDLLSPTSGVHPDIYSASTSQLLCAISETPFSSNLGDQDHSMIEVLVANKHDDLSLESDKPASLELPSGNLSNLEYITDTGEVVQLVRPGQTYMGRDQHGNLVQYKIADIQDQDEASHPIYFIGVDGTVVGSTTGQEQALMVNTNG
ncbi:uncharacterized protein LOC131953751 [Physella acuta]|uniref:uncharacterized protein LOC131953751 n=1 Tax=Physella acuta TaxID=109671 RepID=UPI0027DD29E2|nr:uncharacterized protein LOC131953751 [Physella acuta]XP_059173086.1 uncharacterized protein LOC131953751 [Physella acuta]